MSEDHTQSAASVRSADSVSALFFKRLLELLPDHVYFKDREGRFLAINRAQARFFGLKNPEEAVGKSDYDFFPREQAVLKDRDERDIVRTGVGFIAKEERSDGRNNTVRWVLSTKLPLISEEGSIIGTFGVSRDITEQRITREALHEQHTLFKTLIEILPCRIFVKDREGRIQVSNEAYRRALGVSEPEELLGRRVDEVINNDRVGQIAADDSLILSTGYSILNREEADDWPGIGKGWSLLSKVPLTGVDGTIHGIVGISADITLQKRAIASAIESQRALVQKKNEMEAELILARDMQTELMSASVQVVRESLGSDTPFRTDFSWVYRPCEHLAGDFFQAVPLGPSRFGLLVCDVMGHGVKAALVTTLLRGLLAELCSRDATPSEVLSALNERLCILLDRPAFPRFVTALYATVDLESGHLVAASAGHPWPIWMDAHSGPAPISTEESGPALGLVRGATYQSEERLFVPGTRFLFYTDGLQEELNEREQEFGQERILQLMADTAAHPPQDSLDELLRAVCRYNGKRGSNDDICAVMLAF